MEDVDDAEVMQNLLNPEQINLELQTDVDESHVS